MLFNSARGRNYSISFICWGSLVLMRWIANMLFGVSPISLPIYAAVCLLLATVAAVAIAVPSKRATRVDPLVALRDS